MKQFINPLFWFDVRPLPFLALFFWPLLIICLAALVFGIIFTILRHRRFKNNFLIKKILTKSGRWFYSFSLIGLALIFFRQQMVLYLGMRFWFAIWLLSHLVWLVFILKFILLEVPKAKKEIARKKEFEKYLP